LTCALTHQPPERSGVEVGTADAQSPVDAGCPGGVLGGPGLGCARAHPDPPVGPPLIDTNVVGAITIIPTIAPLFNMGVGWTCVVVCVLMWETDRWLSIRSTQRSRDMSRNRSMVVGTVNTEESGHVTVVGIESPVVWL
jgi:hypothetical protein